MKRSATIVREAVRDIPNATLEEIIRDNTTIDEFDLKLSHIDVTMRIRQIKQQLTEAMLNVNGRQQEL